LHRAAAILRNTLTVSVHDADVGLGVSEAELDAALGPARVMREHGCDIEMLEPAQCVAIEPALASARGMLKGGSMTTSDESGDAHKFTQGLACLAAQRGVKFLHGRNIVSLAREGGRIGGVCQPEIEFEPPHARGSDRKSAPRVIGPPSKPIRT
jgi:glycine/D-amino acid oxidase-like deaminating enzyme